MQNLILATDSYKQSHFLQYPPEARAISAYGESRPNGFSDEVVFFGLQPFLIDYLGKAITSDNIEEAAAICAAHGVPFNREGWEAVLFDHGGNLPLEISALPEGIVVPTGVPLFQVVNTDDRMPWRRGDRRRAGEELGRSGGATPLQTARLRRARRLER